MPAKDAQQQAAYDIARKRSGQILLRLSVDEAERVRAGAAASGKPIRDYVLGLVDDRPMPIVDLAQVAQLSAALAVLASIPKGAHDLEADLGRLSGRLAHFFTLNYHLATDHRAEIHATLDEVQTLLRRVIPELRLIQEAVREPREAICEVIEELRVELRGQTA